jgi:biotin carboxylase
MTPGSPAAKKTLLVISGGLQAVEAARRAKELGFYVIVSDRDPAAPGFAHADSILIADADGADETSAAVERFNRKIRRVDGAISMIAGQPMTLASVTQRLGLSGPSQKTTRLACDKLALKNALKDAGIPVPWFAAAETPQALARIVIEHGRDLVIKPVDSRDGRGVQRLASVADMERAFAVARSHSLTGRVMVERYLDGLQISAQSLVIDGQCATPSLFDRNFEYLDRYAPCFIQNGWQLPSALPECIRQEARLLLAGAANAFGIVRGAVRTDLVVHEGRPYVLDLNTVISADCFCAREIVLSTGVDFMGAAIRLAVGDAVSFDELEPRNATPVVQRCIFPEPGRIVSIAGIDEARAVPGVTDIVVTARLGDIVPRSDDKRPSACMLLATAATADGALATANDALTRIRIVTEPQA